MSDFRIAMNGQGRGEVFIDGKKLDGVLSVEFRAGVNEANRLTITMVGAKIDTGDLHGEADVEIEVTSLDSTSRRFAKP